MRKLFAVCILMTIVVFSQCMTCEAKSKETTANKQAVSKSGKTLPAAHRPKTGHWEGDPSVSFEVTDDGNIHNFNMAYSVGAMTCYIKAEKIDVEKDGGFVVKNFIPDADYKFPEGITKEERDKLYRPAAVTIGKNKMVEVQSITGRFDSTSTVIGNFRILVCKDYQQYFFKNDGEALHGKEWSAKWKEPK